MFCKFKCLVLFILSNLINDTQVTFPTLESVFKALLEAYDDCSQVFHRLLTACTQGMFLFVNGFI